jgi:hypothetical protein
LIYSDDVAGALPGRSVRRQDRQHPLLTPTPSTPVPSARVRSTAGPQFPMDNDARINSATGANCWRRADQSRIYKDMGGGVYDAPRYYLPTIFFRRNRHRRSTAKPPRWVLHGDNQPAFQRFWQDARTATGWLAISPALPSVAVLSAEQFDSRVSRWRCAARLKTLPTTRRSKAQ